MNLIWNVGRGAVKEPRAVFVHYAGNENSDEVELAIVGKGVTYDTGGLNIKLRMMELMHGDKGGAAAVLGALEGSITLGLKKNVVFVFGFAENAIGPECYKPGDILKAMNGLSVEIGNTDAEGRLVMSDCMTYVQRTYKPKQVMYIATLTGAMLMALGTKTAGFFAPDDEMANKVKAAGKDAHEDLWQMPLTESHKEDIHGKWGGDIHNIGLSGFAGACTAAAFLERFVEDNRPWAHLDIAGPAMMEETGGFGARTLLNFINNM